MGVSLDERFWAKVRRDPTGCWEWTGYRHYRWGYGHIAVNRKVQNAHRVAWELTEGEIPAGLLVLHRCDNPPCCRPAHLFLGTHDDNMKDMARKGRQPTKVTALAADAIRASSKTGIDLAKEYGISRALISMIRAGKRWASSGVA